ncbi:MAG: hypothetical protein J6T35_01435 [Bacteroidales bacterium]|nr:hypothetical protein [Bacteroidales bacterium]
MTFIFQTDEKSTSRECSMETAIESARQRIIDGRATFVRLSVIQNGKVIVLGDYSVSDDPEKYMKVLPDVRIVRAEPRPHRIPVEQFWNEEAWRLNAPGEVKCLDDKIRKMK